MVNLKEKNIFKSLSQNKANKKPKKLKKGIRISKETDNFSQEIISNS